MGTLVNKSRMVTTDTITKEYVADFGVYTEGDIDTPGYVVRQHKIRVMSPAEIKHRLELNQANTASNLRAKVVSELATSNGH